MMRTTLWALALFTMAGLLSAGPLTAQDSTKGGMQMDSAMRMDTTMHMDSAMSMGQHGMGMDGTMGMMTMMQSCPMMGAMVRGPQMALMHREQLDLSDAQVQKLEALQANAKQAMTQAMQRMRPLHQQLTEATTGDQFNEQAARSALQRMGALHTDATVAMLRASYQTRQMLTPQQRQALAKAGGDMRGQEGMMGTMGMRGMMGGGKKGSMEMHGCSMMDGGMGGMPMHGSDSSTVRPHHQR